MVVGMGVFQLFQREIRIIGEAEMACAEHGLIVHRVKCVEERVFRVEKFILSTLVFFAVSSGSVIYILLDLPSRIAHYEVSAEQEQKLRKEVRAEYEEVRRQVK